MMECPAMLIVTIVFKKLRIPLYYDVVCLTQIIFDMYFLTHLHNYLYIPPYLPTY